MVSGYCEKHGKPIVSTGGQCEDCYKPQGVPSVEAVEVRVTKIINKQAAEIIRLRAEVETFKRLYNLRGQALARPCLRCGYESKRITLADGSMEETTDG